MRNFIVFLLILCTLYSCQKEVSADLDSTPSGGGGVGGGPGGSTSTATYYYKANIGGVNYTESVTNTNDFQAGSGLGGTNEVEFSADISPMTSPQPLNTTSIEINKGLFNNYLSSTNAQFKAFFNPGDYPYTTGPEGQEYINGNGVYIMWMDKQGSLWSTSFGSHDQAGSTFQILSVVDDADPVHYYVRVKAVFKCKLYKEATGEMKQVTNGEFVGLFGKI